MKRKNLLGGSPAKKKRFGMGQSPATAMEIDQTDEIPMEVCTDDIGVVNVWSRTVAVFDFVVPLWIDRTKIVTTAA